MARTGGRRRVSAGPAAGSGCWPGDGLWLELRAGWERWSRWGRCCWRWPFRGELCGLVGGSWQLRPPCAALTEPWLRDPGCCRCGSYCRGEGERHRAQEATPPPPPPAAGRAEQAGLGGGPRCHSRARRAAHTVASGAAPGGPGRERAPPTRPLPPRRHPWSAAAALRQRGLGGQAGLLHNPGMRPTDERESRRAGATTRRGLEVAGGRQTNRVTWAGGWKREQERGSVEGGWKGAGVWRTLVGGRRGRMAGRATKPPPGRSAAPLGTMAALGQQAVPVKCGRASSGREEPTLRAGAHWVLLQPQREAGGDAAGEASSPLASPSGLAPALQEVLHIYTRPEERAPCGSSTALFPLPCLRSSVYVMLYKCWAGKTACCTEISQ
ncbi:putative uncharacterized protein FRMD6-AS1 [Chelonia mydas]|uniref:putative uncharacterized protein FRMD6-AS1 n=1 Tax=Chelonia mydas TaxID=8469 RepID=UPI001CAA1F5D|nr:putative uncharacterized protein FRMD6-AS1 [Chelonia mydas]